MKDVAAFEARLTKHRETACFMARKTARKQREKHWRTQGSPRFRLSGKRLRKINPKNSK
jgi:hypothetical protein